MANDIFFSILIPASGIVPLIISVAVLVMGIVVIISKVRQTKILGLSLILSSLAGIITCVYRLDSLSSNSGMIAGLRMLNTYANAVLSLAVSFCICFYIHKTYNKRSVYIPVFLIPIAAGILKTVIAFLINRGPDNGASRVLIPLIQSIISLPVFIVVSVILLMVFYKNRNIEKIIPKTYIVRLINLVWGCFSGAYAILMYALMYASSKIRESDFPSFLVWLAHYSQPLNMIFTIIGSFMSLIFPIYLLISIRKASRQPEVPEA